MIAQFLIRKRDGSAGEALPYFFCNVHFPRPFNRASPVQKPVRHVYTKGVEVRQFKPDGLYLRAITLRPKDAILKL